jgi:pimeloyl-ACP methyl ester carboxylesterase
MGDTAEKRVTAGDFRQQIVTVNGVRFYCEICGCGRPLVMLHGGLGGIAEFGPLPALLGRTRQVIAIELHGHGRTSAAPRPLHYTSMADDIAHVLGMLGVNEADVLGFSLGGGIALRLAIQHPRLVQGLILISTPAARAALHPWFREGMSGLTAHAAQHMLDTPMYALYSSTAPDASAWPALVGQVGDLLRQDYDWAGSLASLAMPVLCIVGDQDMISVADIADTFGAQAQARIVVMPETDHFTMLARTRGLYDAITGFLHPRKHA